MIGTQKNLCLFLAAAMMSCCLTATNSQDAPAQEMRRVGRGRLERANNDPAKAAAVYGATTTPAGRYANQVQHQSNQDNRQSNWNNKTENQKAVDYNAATIHHSNTEATQAAEKNAFSSRASANAGSTRTAGAGNAGRLSGRHR